MVLPLAKSPLMRHELPLTVGRFHILSLSCFLHVPTVPWIQDMREARHTQAPLSLYIPVCIHYYQDGVGPSYSDKSFFGELIVAMRGDNERDAWVRGRGGAKAKEGFRDEGAVE